MLAASSVCVKDAKTKSFGEEISLNMHIAMHDFFAYSFELLISLRIFNKFIQRKYTLR